MTSCLCCCTSEPRQKSKPKTKPAPSNSDSRIRRHPPSNDASAIEYWRQRQEGNLQKTYEITTQPPLHPENGSILHPAVTPPRTAPRPSGGAFERFEPEIQRSGLVTTLSQDREANIKGSKIISIVSKEIGLTGSFDNGESEVYSQPPTRHTFVSDEDKQLANLDPFDCFGPSFNGMKDPFRKRGRRMVTEATTPPSPEPEDDDDDDDQFFGPSFADVKDPFGTPESGIVTEATTTLSPEPEDDDQLSSIGSDVSPETKELYIKACRMLKNGLVNGQRSFDESEREFILSVLGDAAAAGLGRGSVVNVEGTYANEIGASQRQHSTIPSFPAATNATKPISAEPIFKAAKGKKESIVGLPTCGPKEFKEVQEPAETTFEEEPNRQPQHLVALDDWAHQEITKYPFQILGASDQGLEPRVLTLRMLEAFRGFFPFRVCESNFWLKFSLARDGASLATLLESIKASTYTIIAVETTHGEVFGSFNGTPWRRSSKWFGSGEAFLWRLKQPRITVKDQAENSNLHNEMEVYPFTGCDNMVQYCTSCTIAVGGGDWLENEFPFGKNEPRGIGFMLDGDLIGGETNSCATFANPRLCKKTSLSNEFGIRNMEVWTLTPFDNEEEAAQLEMHKLLLDRNARRRVV